MADRVTHYRYGRAARVDERVDEIVATGANVHLEMLSEDSAYLRVGGQRFALYATKQNGRRQLVVRLREEETKNG